MLTLLVFREVKTLFAVQLIATGVARSTPGVRQMLTETVLQVVAHQALRPMFLWPGACVGEPGFFAAQLPASRFCCCR